MDLKVLATGGKAKSKGVGNVISEQNENLGICKTEKGQSFDILHVNKYFNKCIFSL